MLWMPDFFLDRAKVVRKYPDGLLPTSSVRSKVYQFPNSGRVYYPAGSTETEQCDMLPGKALTSPVTSTIGRCHIAFFICVILCLQYPFDTHTCNVTIHSFSYTTSDYTLKVLHIRTSTS